MRRGGRAESASAANVCAHFAGRNCGERGRYGIIEAMGDERRTEPRLPGPYDGAWSGSSGLRNCRITDLSAGGCFVDSFTAAEAGASLVLTVALHQREYRLPAEVVYIDRVQGFGVKFLPSEDADALRDALNAR